jgi:hypothetical protein
MAQDGGQAYRFWPRWVLTAHLATGVNSHAVKMHHPDANLMKTVLVLLGYLIPQHKNFVNEISAPLRGLIM